MISQSNKPKKVIFIVLTMILTYLLFSSQLGQGLSSKEIVEMDDCCGNMMESQSCESTEMIMSGQIDPASFVDDNVDQGERTCGCRGAGCTCPGVECAGQKHEFCSIPGGCNKANCGCSKVCAHNIAYKPCGARTGPCNCNGDDCSCSANICQNNKSGACGGKEDCDCGGSHCTSCPDKCRDGSPDCGGSGSCTCEDDCNCGVKCDSHNCSSHTMSCACSGLGCGTTGCDGTHCEHMGCPNGNCPGTKSPS